ncbi:MAG: tetratricopeptide repeat protein [candidate division WOR-3 bacterium]
MTFGILFALATLAQREKMTIEGYMRPFREAFSSYISVVSDAEDLYYSERYEAAFNKYNAILKGAEKSDYKMIGYIGMAWCYIGLGRYSDALKMLKQADLYAPSDPKTHIMTLMGNGISSFNLGKYPEAYRYFSRITDDYRDYLEYWRDAYYFKALSAYAKGDYPQTITDVETILKDSLHFRGYEKRADAYILGGKAALNGGNYEKAVTLLNGFISEFPTHPKAGEARLLLAEAEASKGSYKAAMTAYENVLNTYPYLKDQALESMARVSVKFGDYIVGDTSFRITHPLMVEVFLWVPAVEAHNKGNLAKAMPRFLRMARDVPEDERSGKGLALIGQAFADQGSYTKAAEIFRQYIVQYPAGEDIAKVMNLLANCYIKMNQWREALKVLDEIIYRFGQDESQKDLVDGAKKKLSAIINEHPDAAEGLSFKTPGLSQDAAFQQAAAAYNQGDYAKSAQLFLEFADKNPGDPKACKAVFNAGYIYFQAKDYANAVSALSRYVSGCGSGEDAENAYFYLGASYYFAGDYARSASTMEGFVSYFPASSMKPNALKLAGLSYLELGNQSPSYKDKGIERLKESARVFRAQGNPTEAEKIEKYLEGMGIK